MNGKKRKEKIEKKKISMKKKVCCNKTRSTKNQFEISLGEFQASWKKMLCVSESNEIYSFILRYLNSFIPFFQLTKHLNPWPHYKLQKSL